MLVYHSVLTEREQVWHDCQTLEHENEELSRLLQQQQTAEINFDLVLPPAKQIQLNAAGNQVPKSQ